ncbi:MAG: PAS domain S-box protein [Ignavibacteriae bacterium]|nr:PAS domain S-box protein [Ignavibacteriota bacterium]
MHQSETSGEKNNENTEIQLKILSIALEQTADCVIITDRDGIIQYVNAAFEKETGYTREEAVGKIPRFLKSEKHENKYYKRLWNTILSGNVFRGVLINKRKDGNIIYEDKTITPLKNEKGEITHFVSTAKNITEQKLIEESLQRSEERDRELFETTNELIHVLTPDGRFLFVNRAWREALGYSEDEIENLVYRQIIHPENEQHYDTIFRRALAGEEIDRLETSFITKDGKKLELEGSIKCRFEEGVPKNITYFLSDVTHQRKIEEERLKLQTILEESLNEIYVFDAETWKFQYVNEAARRNLGYSAEHLDNCTPLDLKPEFTEAKFRELLLPLFNHQQKQVIFQTVHQRNNGSTYPVEVHLQLVEQSSKQVFLAVIFDITERLKIKEKLLLAARTLESISEITTITDLENRFIFVNKAFVEKYGYTYEDVLGQHIRMLAAPEVGNEVLEEIYSKTLQGGWSGELLNQTKDGNIFPISLTTSKIHDENGNILGLVGIAVDITERKKAEEKRKSLEQQLLQAQKLESLGTLASGIAHDFNNILTIIIGHASLFNKYYDDKEKCFESIASITKASQRGASLVKQLLTFARKTETTRQAMCVNSVVSEIAKLIGETFPKTILLSIQQENHLPVIVADSSQIHQVLLNLCVNARDAMPNGGTLTLATTVIEANFLPLKFPRRANIHEYIEIRVSDTGMGIEEGTMKRIFEPFFTTKELGKGTGLGLSVVFGIIEDHHGFVDVTSSVGMGTTFILYLPVPENTEKINRSEVVAKEISGGTETLLIVEDEEMLREMLKVLLEMKGYHIITAQNGEEGIQLYREYQSRISAVVTDMGLPRTSGDEVFRKIKSMNPVVPVILASGFIDPNVKSGLATDGAKHFVQKPYSPDELLKTIRNCIDGK